MRQCELKKRYDPDLDAYVTKHIYGEGISDVFKSIGRKITKQPTDIKDGSTKLTFKYTLSGTTATDYSVYALVLYEQDVEMRKTDGKLILRSM